KRPELAFSYSWGSGIHRSHVAVFDVLAKEPKEYVAPQSYFEMQDMKLKHVDDKTVEVRVGDTKVGHLRFESKDGESRVFIDFDKDLDAKIKKHFQGVK